VINNNSLISKAVIKRGIFFIHPVVYIYGIVLCKGQWETLAAQAIQKAARKQKIFCYLKCNVHYLSKRYFIPG
jgi:hypothetical protein